MIKICNVKYAMIQALYWMLYCVFLGYASVYLLDKQYTNSQIGVILAVGFLCSVFLQNLVATITDHAKKVTVIQVTLICTCILLLTVLALCLARVKSPFMTIAFVCLCIMIMLIQPLVNAINFHFEKRLIPMNFGVARSMGSLFYAMISVALGYVIKWKNADVLPVTGIALIVILLFILVTLTRDDRILLASLQQAGTTDSSVQQTPKKRSLQDFFAKYKTFFLFLIGGLGLFLSHASINNFFYQVILNIHGDSSDLGAIHGFSAMVELPPMIFFDKLKKKFGCKRLLRFASVFFFLKILLTYLSPSIPFLYLAMVCQMFAFAIFIPASVHFVNETMEPQDAVKGQAFVTAMITLANLLSSLFGGMIIDTYGTSTLLLLSAIITFVGTVITFIALRNQFECS